MQYVAAKNIIFCNPAVFTDVAPAERWSYDLLEANGAAKMRQVAEDVKAMCQGLRPEGLKAQKIEPSFFTLSSIHLFY